MPRQKPTNNYRLMIALLLVVVILFLTYVSFRNYKVEKYSEENKVTIILIHATWCGHCVKYLKDGTFDKLSDELSDMTICKFEKIDYDTNKSLAEKYDVKGFPSIIAVNASGDKLLDFSTFKNGKANRNDLQDLKEFVDAAVAASGSQ